MGQRRLAESGRPVEEQVVEWLGTLERSLDRDLQVVLQLLLADELTHAPWPERAVQRRVVVLDIAGGDALSRRGAARFRMRVPLSTIVGSGAARGLCASGAKCARRRRA